MATTTRRYQPRHARRPPPTPPAPPWVAWAAAALPALIIGAGGWAHRWAAEDAYIDFRVIDNILAGHGPVFNVGERVEVFTDALWVWMLALVHLVVPAALGWEAVVLGLVGSVGGVLLAGRGTQHLAGRPGAAPVGLLAFCSIASAWDFATSGLETGLIFAWQGVTWWLIARVRTRGAAAAPVAVVAGLGPLIRPDMALLSAAYLVALVVAGTAPAARPELRRTATLLGAAVVLPLAYEVFRGAYFGMLVPNTAVAKSASSLWVGQGLHYIGDLSSTFHLLVLAPFLLAALAWNVGAAGHAGRPQLTVALAPVVGGVVSMAYVVAIGGDFMRARMLLPGLFAVMMTVWVALPRIDAAGTRLPRLAGAGVLAWSAVTVAVVRSPLDIRDFPRMNHGIVDERLFWAHAASRSNPVTLDEYRDSFAVRLGSIVSAFAARQPEGGRASQLELFADPRNNLPLLPTGAAAPPAQLVYRQGVIGILGVTVGPRVYINDQLALADPVGSHVVLPFRTRPGEKMVPPAWAVARFAAPGIGSSPALATLHVDPMQVAAARQALACDPLHDYLRSITAPLTVRGALHDLVHSPSWTTFRFSSDAVTATRQLCGDPQQRR